MSVERIVRLHEFEKRIGVGLSGQTKLWFVAHASSFIWNIGHAEHRPCRRSLPQRRRGRAALQGREKMRWGLGFSL
jgi:hypothetical protein